MKTFYFIEKNKKIYFYCCSKVLFGIFSNEIKNKTYELVSKTFEIHPLDDVDQTILVCPICGEQFFKLENIKLLWNILLLSGLQGIVYFIKELGIEEIQSK